MSIFRIFHILLLLQLAISAGSPLFGLSKKNELIPTLPKNNLVDRDDYTSCRTKALANQTGGEKHVKTQLNLCRERHPNFAYLAECKKQKIAKYGDADDEEKLKSELQACTTEQEKIAFKPSETIPFERSGSRVFFAGVDLTYPRLIIPQEKTAEAITPDPEAFLSNQINNFDCTPLQEALFNSATGEFLLFGNDPRIFSKLTVPYQTLVAKFESLGSHHRLRITGLDRKSPLVIPELSPCVFDRKVGNLFESIKIYHLLNHSSKFGIPYFGIVFYKANSLETKVSQFSLEVAAKLGQEYQSFTRPNKTFIAKTGFSKFDGDGDPINICKDRKKHEYVAIIGHRADKTPSYLILSNIANLCSYGDRFIGGLIK